MVCIMVSLQNHLNHFAAYRLPSLPNFVHKKGCFYNLSNKVLQNIKNKTHWNPLNKVYNQNHHPLYFSFFKNNSWRTLTQNIAKNNKTLSRAVLFKYFSPDHLYTKIFRIVDNHPGIQTTPRLHLHVVSSIYYTIHHCIYALSNNQKWPIYP